jgi:hypothetical protein
VRESKLPLICVTWMLWKCSPSSLTRLCLRSLDLTKTLGAALLDQKRYVPAAELLSKYLKALGTPATDGVAAHKLAMALSYAGEPAKAVAVIYELPQEIREDPETQGILGGCFKREWIKSKKPDLALSAREFYTKGLEAAKARSDLAGVIYNGINAAYMELAINGKGHGEVADTVLVALAGNNTPDYWGLATRAEALLLKGDFIGPGLTARRYADLDQESLQTVLFSRDQAKVIAVVLNEGLDVLNAGS